MKKILSLLCAIAVLATCISNIPMALASETEETYYHVERFNIDDKITIEDALIELNNGEEYEHTLEIPLGWDWFSTVGKGAEWLHNPDTSTDVTCIRSLLQEIEGTTYLRRTGTDVALTKMVDIEPGYQYTLTSTAFSTKADDATQSSLAYFLYHKNEDGTYTEINEYLESIGAQTLTNTMQKTKYYASRETNEIVSFNGNPEARSAELSLTFKSEYKAVNAIMVAIGGYGGGSNSRNFAVWHEGFEIAQGEEVDIIYDGETFTADYEEKEITINGIWNGTPITYTATHQLPSNKWTVEKYEDGTSDYQLNNYISNETIVGQSSTAVSREPFYQVKGSAVRLAKYIEIEPGYEYTLSVDATAFGKSGVWSTAHVYLYHKSEDGSYTPINEYLTQNRFQKTVETVKFTGTEGSDLGTYTESSRYATGNNCYDIPVDVAFTITDPSVNAIKITLGGRTNKELGPTAGVYYFGYKIVQGSAVDMVSNEMPPYLTLETVGENKVVRYVPEDIPEVIASETIPMIPETYTVPDAAWGGYNHELTIPTGWGWKATGRNSWCDQTLTNKIGLISQGTNKLPAVFGGDVALTKYVDNVVPGFTYKITSTVYIATQVPSAQNNGVTLEAWLCNKDGNGNYTILSETPATFKALPQDLTLGTEISTGYGKMKAADIQVSIDANVDNANAILIGFSGYNNYSSTNQLVGVRGFKVTKIPENIPTIIIAAYKEEIDGSLALAKVAITKNAPKEDGSFEAPYNMDLSEITGTVKVKAFVWNDLSKLSPVITALQIQ